MPPLSSAAMTWMNSPSSINSPFNSFSIETNSHDRASQSIGVPLTIGVSVHMAVPDTGSKPLWHQFGCVDAECFGETCDGLALRAALARQHVGDG